MISLSRLFIYPIKSTAPLELDNAEVQAEGLAHDRRYVVTDRRGRFITARRLPHMVLIRATRQGDGLEVNAPDQPTLQLDPMRFPDDYDPIKVWQDELPGQRCGAEADKWFTRYLGLEARLYYMGPQSRRPARGGGVVSFADAAALLVLSQASVDDLNTRLQQSVGVRNFRPNLLVTGCEAYAEDEWSGFTIGTAAFKPLGRCARCILTTIDPDTGVMHPQRQPLETLRGYRLGEDDDNAYFGRNVAVAQVGHVEAGQPLIFSA